MIPSLLLTRVPPAAAQEPTSMSTSATSDTEETEIEIRGLDVAMWATLLLLLAIALAGWRSARRWADDHLEPILGRVREATASIRPPRLVPLIPPHAPPLLLGEAWLRPGHVHLVLSKDPQVLLRLTRELLAQDDVAVAIASTRVGPDALSVGIPAAAGQRALWTPDSPNEAMLAAIAVRGRPVVVLLDEVPSEEFVGALTRWQAIGVLVRDEDPGLAGTAGWRRAS